MIFDKEFVGAIQEAIESRDEAFFFRYLKAKKRGVKKSFFSSALMVSAHRAKHLNKLDELQADAAIINLEDGVAKEYKRVALLAAALFLQEAPKESPLLVVRVNPLDEGGKEEIEFLNDFFPDAIRVAKIKTKEDALLAEKLIKEPINIHFSIETKEALNNLEHLRVSKRVKAYYLGILDLLADLDIPQSVLQRSNPTIDYLLSRFLIGSKMSNVWPVSFVYQEYQNLEAFEAWCEYEFAMGYRAKGCISPKQVEIVNRVMKSGDVKRAIYIKEKFEQMQAKGISGFSDEKYGFIDEPIYKDALNILNGRKNLQ